MALSGTGPSMRNSYHGEPLRIWLVECHEAALETSFEKIAQAKAVQLYRSDRWLHWHSLT